MSQVFDKNTQEGTTGPVFYGEGSFNGLKFFNEIKDNLDFDRHLTCIPTVTLLNSNANILLDYTNCISSTSSQYIKDIIKGISLGAGFTLENAKYIDPESGVESDLSGTFVYSATFDKAIYGTVSTVDTAENLDKTYRSEGFFDDFNAIFSVQNTDTTENNTIKNLFGSSIKPSFSSLGLKVGDFIKIVEGSNASSTLHEVTTYYKDYNDHEIVQFGNSADFLDENRISSPTNLRLYRNPPTSSATQESSIIDAVGNAVSVGQNSITNLTGRVNVITMYIKDNCFYSAAIKKPTFVFSVGSSYVFNLTEPSVLAENFLLRISSTPDGKWGGGVPHPDVYVTDNLLVFEPQTSGTFYYYCENHPNSGGIIQINTTNINNTLQLTPVFLDTASPLTQALAGNSGIYD